MGTLAVPVLDGVSAQRFPVVTIYQPAAIEPADWHLTLGLETSDILDLQAVCSGTLTTVPPHELLGAEFSTLATSGAMRPDVTRFYLQPDPGLALEWQTSLGYVGEIVLWYLYDGVDATALDPSIIEALDNNKSLVKLLPDSADRELAFLNGQAAVHVYRGQLIGSASTALAYDPNDVRLEFGVHTTVGYIDPVHFYDRMAEHIDEYNTADADELVRIVPTDWPYFAGTIDEITEAKIYEKTAQLLYPFPVLWEMIMWAGITPDSSVWLQVAAFQKYLYLQRLYNNYVSGTGPFFAFQTADMLNPFQLEAIVEFYNFWQTPGASLTPPIEDFLALFKVNLSLGDSTKLVLIDPFDHVKLGAPPLPKPDYQVSGRKPTGNPCSPDGPQVDATYPLYPPDEYKGVMFILYQGLVRTWFRWTSYTSHKWEDTAQGSCNVLTSSIQGNLEYRFYPHYGSESFKNYSFTVYYAGVDATILATRTGAQGDYNAKGWVPGRYYFRKLSLKDIQDPDGKTWVLFHSGHIEQDQESCTSSGSGGCIVSPAMPLFRAAMIDLYLISPNRDPVDDDKMRMIQACRTQPASEDLYGSKIASDNNLQKIWVPAAGSKNEEILTGVFWLIRPDEPTQK